MAEETIDPGVLEQTKNQIRKLVAEIAELAESDIQPPEFHAEFLNRVIAAVAASGGALWLLDGKGSLKLQHHLEFGLTGLLDGRTRSQPHDALLGCMMRANQPQIIPPGAAIEGVPGAGNPTGFALILAPLIVEKQVVGLVEILMDPTRRAATQKSTLRFVSDLCDLAAQYLKNRQNRQIVSQQRLWTQLELFSQTVHSSLDLKETAYAVANEGKRLIGCDRLSVCLKLGGRPLIEAVSGQEVVEQRANLIRELTRLCKAVMRSGEDLVYTGNTETFAPDLRDALEMYVDESGAKSVIIVLLHKPETDTSKEKTVYGCLVSEQIGDELASTDAHARSEVVARHASTALWNAREHDKIFLLPVLKAIGSPVRFFKGRTLAKIGAVLLAVVGVVAALAFVPWKLTIEGRGSLQTTDRSNTYAPEVGGVVNEIFVEHGQKVKKGDILLKLESKELDKNRTEAVKDRDAAIAQEGYLRRQDAAHSSGRSGRPEDEFQIKGQLREAEIKRDGAKEQIRILDSQIKSLTVLAPIDGIVTTWDVRKNLQGRPMEQGAELISIAATEGDWDLEVDVPDDDMGPILDAQHKLKARIANGTMPPGSTLSGYFVLATDPEHRYPGYVKRIASKAETIEGKHGTKVTVGFSSKVREDFLQHNREFRPGAEVRARVDCGQARLAYVLLRDVIHFFHETILFRWPFLN